MQSCTYTATCTANLAVSKTDQNGAAFTSPGATIATAPATVSVVPATSSSTIPVVPGTYSVSSTAPAGAAYNTYSSVNGGALTLGTSVSVPVAAGATATVAWRYFPVSQFAVTLTGASTGCGSGSMAVVAKDARGTIVPAYRGTVHWTSTGSTGTLPGSYTFTASDGGSHSFPITFHGDGLQSFTVTDGAGVVGSFTTDVVGTICPAVQLAITGLPATTTAGVPTSFTVAALDAYGNRETGYSGSVSFATSAQEAEPVHQSFLPADMGSRVFSATFELAGPRTLSVADDADGTLNGSASISVGAGSFSEFVMPDTGVPVRAGFAINLALTAFDAYGNVIPDYAGTVHFTSNDPAATVPPDFRFTGTEGGETVLDHGLVFGTAGKHLVTAADTSGAGILSVRTVSVTSAPTACSGVFGSNWNGGALTLNWCGLFAGSDLYSISENGTLIANLVPGFTFPISGLAAGSNYTFTVQAERQRGARGDCGAFQSCLVFNYDVIGTAQWSIDDSAPAVRLSVAGLPSAMQTGTPASVTVKALDANGNLAVGYLGTIHFSSSDPSAALPPDSAFDSIRDLGVRTFPIAFANPAVDTSVTVTDVHVPSITGSQSGIAVTGPTLPPDPSLNPSPVNGQTATAIADSTAFLYTGINPPQTGVTPGAIDVRQAAVVRGKVQDAVGNGLGAVAVSVYGHPELGSTLSRADGGFDLAVNGGTELTLVFARDGYHSAQRKLQVPWSDFRWLRPIRLLSTDPSVSVVDLSDAANYHLLRGATRTDANGSRKTLVFIPVATQASLLMPDGSTQTLASQVLHLRSTEYTVGGAGPDSMPASLPPTSAYTFAASFTADEEVAAGAKSLVFTQPVYAYVDNFLGMRVGSLVPVGTYDHQQATWVPQDNGRVIQIVGVSGSQALVDTDGDGAADSITVLSALGFTNSELEMLACNYQVGQSLWRAPLEHFSDEDLNWPPGPPPGAVPPPPMNPKQSRNVDCAHEHAGSIIECENQTLGERTGIAGTPYTLNYRSDRQAGRLSNRRLDIPVGGSFNYHLPGCTPPPAPAANNCDYGIGPSATVSIAGQVIPELNFTNQPGPLPFVWDGKDAYGRVVQGAVPVTITSCNFGYPSLFYTDFIAEQRAFAQAGEGGSVVEIPGSRDGVNLALCAPPWHGLLGGFDVQPLGLGGWTLSPHHAYDPVGAVLYKGDGTRQEAHNLNRPRARKVVSVREGDNPVEGAKASTTLMSSLVGAIAFGPDGTLYFT